jgi:hypothetical protein
MDTPLLEAMFIGLRLQLAVVQRALKHKKVKNPVTHPAKQQPVIELRQLPQLRPPPALLHLLHLQPGHKHPHPYPTLSLMLALITPTLLADRIDIYLCSDGSVEGEMWRFGVVRELGQIMVGEVGRGEVGEYGQSAYRNDGNTI